MQIEPLAIPIGAKALSVLPRLAEALRGVAPIAPYAVGSPPPSLPPFAELPEDLAVVVGTSGSTGTPKLAMLTTSALAASIGATHRHLGGPGQWLLAMPAHHIAGLQVLLRGLVAGTRTITLDTSFTIDGFIDATRRLDPDERHYTALVPTQVARLLAHCEGPDALRRFDAILVGGAALPPRLRASVDEAGVVLVATYGMSETAGGCVYDGTPIPGTRLRIEDDGRILLGTAALASGYLDDPARTAESFVIDEDGTSWFRTDDHGHLLPDGRLQVDGRLDDLINTGGLKVAPRIVEEAIASGFPEISEVVVVGVPDEQWGQRVSALLVMGTDRTVDPTHTNPATPPTLADMRDRLRGILPPEALPQQVATADALPTKGPGKPDRAAIVTLLAERPVG